MGIVILSDKNLFFYQISLDTKYVGVLFKIVVN